MHSVLEHHISFPITSTVCTRFTGHAGITGCVFSVSGHVTSAKKTHLSKELANTVSLKVNSKFCD